MTTSTTAHDHLAELIELKEATAHILIETRYAVRVRNAHVCAANDRAEFKQFINDSAINAADIPTIGTKPCK